MKNKHHHSYLSLLNSSKKLKSLRDFKGLVKSYRYESKDNAATQVFSGADWQSLRKSFDVTCYQCSKNPDRYFLVNIMNENVNRVHQRTADI